MPSDPSKAVWYYADGDVERGPVTETQIRMLIGTGNLAPDDLVWKEGMDDWMPAGRVPGLFENKSEAKEKSITKTLKQKKPPISESPVADDPPRPRKSVRMPSVALALEPSKPTDLLRYVVFAGQPLLLVGLLLVLCMRGCDAVGARYVGRLEAKAQVVEQQFDDEWEDQKHPLERRRQELLDTDKPTTDQQEELESIRTRLVELNAAKSAEQAKLRNGRWRDLKSSARDARANQDMWRFWREGCYWLGLTCLAFGVLVIGFTGRDAERWMCLVILAIVVFALVTSDPGGVNGSGGGKDSGRGNDSGGVSGPG